MGFDLSELRKAVEAHGRVVRVVIAAVKGSSPRETGAAMLVWDTGQSGTIGGGALEFQALQAARELSDDHLSHHSLGPELGQCCGGTVTLLSEIYDKARVAAVRTDLVLRPAGSDRPVPFSVKRLLARARDRGDMPTAGLYDGWMVEPVLRPSRTLWVWGAGHVGRALIGTMSPLPDFDLTWVDTSADRFPQDVPVGVTVLPALKPDALVSHAPVDGEHLIVTYSHRLDLELCHRLLSHGFGYCGLIGSATKWARFRSRLSALGHGSDAISRITCPIGQPSLGKHPQAIALGVGSQLLAKQGLGHSAKETKKA